MNPMMSGGNVSLPFSTVRVAASGAPPSDNCGSTLPAYKKKVVALWS
jgi:hypothetical protein